jgi:hypothetical protein
VLAVLSSRDSLTGIQQGQGQAQASFLQPLHLAHTDMADDYSNMDGCRDGQEHGADGEGGRGRSSAPPFNASIARDYSRAAMGDTGLIVDGAEVSDRRRVCPLLNRQLIVDREQVLHPNHASLVGPYLRW